MTADQPKPLTARLNLRKSVVFALAEFVINIALVFLSYRLVILQGGLEAVGVWATLFAWTTLIRLGDAGMANATLRFIAMRDIETQAQDVRTYAETGILANAALFAILAITGYAIMAPFVPALVGPAHEAEAAAVLPWLFLSFLLLNISGVILGTLQGLHLGFRRSQISVAGTLLQLVAVFLLVPRLGLMGLAVAQIIQYGATAIIGWLLVRRSAKIGDLLPWRFSVPAFRDMLGYSLKAQAANIANGLFEPLSKILVAQFGGMAMQGLYELAFKAVALSRNAIASGLMASLPAMTHLGTRGLAEARSLYDRSVKLTTIAISAVALGLVAASPLIGYLWLGETSLHLTFFIALIAAGFVFNTIGAPAYNLGLATGQMTGNIATAVGSLVILLTFGWVLGTTLGATGVIAIVGLCLAANGVAIRLINERLFRHEAAV